ncbi:MAG: glycosyltransferase family 39 protein [Gammaproteobacteria bacterium]|nr:glycosyltransferase family 39 protein [Gammaproteobacteria bacterium]
MFNALCQTLNSDPQKLFWRFIILHLIVWTLLPVLFHPNMPIDASETITWGHEWQLGYERHPPLSAWLAEIAVTLSGNQLWSYFLLSQLCIVAGFWAVWKLAHEWLNEARSLIAVVLLEGVYYYNFTSPEFNPNVLLLGLWPLTVLVFRYSLVRGDIKYWLACGLFAGLSVLAKYHTAFLFLSMFAVLLSTHAYRKTFRQPGLYLAIVLGIFIISPHLYWVTQNDFTTITYGLDRSTAEKADVANLYYPIKFAGSQLLAILFCLIAFIALKAGQPAFPRAGKSDPFPWIIGLGPFVIMLLLSAIFGMRLKSMWGTPAWFLAGVLLMIYFRPDIGIKNFKRFLITLLIVSAFIVSAYITQLTIKLRERAHFPGNEIGTFFTNEWHKRFNAPLEYVVARLSLGGNVAFYSKDRPSVYVQMEDKRSGWIDKQDFLTKGAVLVWDVSIDGESLPVDWLNRYPNIEIQTPVTFKWRRFNEKNPPVKLGWAFIEPQK